MPTMPPEVRKLLSKEFLPAEARDELKRIIEIEQVINRDNLIFKQVVKRIKHTAFEKFKTMKYFARKIRCIITLSDAFAETINLKIGNGTFKECTKPKRQDKNG